MSKYLVEFKRNRCKGCEMCIFVCPKKILCLDKAETNQKGYHPACITNVESCIGCANCALMCPDGVISIYKDEKVGV